MSRSNWGLFLCLVLVVTWTRALEPEKCAAQSRQIIVNPDAEAFIGVVLPVRAAGAGLLGCGLPTQDGVELLEALRWATGVLNSGTESLVPGVKLGLRIWDTCGHSNEVVHALAELLPVLREGPALCTPGLATNGSSLLVGIVDGAGATKDPVIRQTLTQYSVPLLVLEPETLVAAEDRAKAVMSLAQELQWRQVAIVYGSDDYGTRMYRAAVRQAADSDLCVVAAERLGSDEDSRTAQATLAAVRNAANVAAATPRGSNVTGVLVLSRRSHYLPLLDSLRHTDSQGLQWLFSDLLTTSDVNNGLSSDRFFSLTLAPPSIPPFEQYWANQVQQSGRNIDNNLVQEFEMTRRGCRLPGWAGPNISELPNCNAEPPKRDSPDSLRAAMRGRNAAAALHVVHTLAYALRAAWRENCQGAGVCPGLRLISRQEFSSKYLSPLEFDHAEPGSRVAGLPRGGKLRAGDPSEMAASSLALLSYRGDRSEKLHKLFEYHLDGVEVSDRSFRSQGNRVDLSCSDEEDQGQCPRCLKLREARVRGSTSARSVSTSAPRLPSHHTISSPQHVYIAGLFSVHGAPLPGSPLLGECGPVIPTAARQVEAFTWALRRVNERILTPLGIKLGAILLDTCQSAARALTLPAALIGETSEPILAAVNGLSDEEAKAATSVFTALNVTTVATASHRIKEERYSMQIAPAASSMASAVQGVLQHLGWDYVSVVTSQGDDAAELGVKALREGPVCIAMEETLDDVQLETVLAKLVTAKEGGARGIVLWTKPQDTRRLLTSVARARAAGSLKSDELFWLVVDPQNEASAILEEFGDVIGGAIVFSPEQKPVRDFLQYLRRLRQDEIRKMDDNPWLEAYYDQVLQSCTGSECERTHQFLLEEGNPQDARTVQAVFSLGAAIARARRDYCPDLPAGIPGLCPPGGGRPDMKQVLNGLLHYMPSERAWGGEEFKFTPRGAGDVVIEILNLRRGGARVKSRGLAPGINFEKVGIFRGEMQSLASLLGYRDSGEEVPLAALTSRCSRSCSKCRSTDRFIITHPPLPSDSNTMYIGVSLGMQEPAPSHPLECGSEATARGVQQLEALLWALDRANMNSSLRLSAVVMNSCGSPARTSRDVAQLLDDSGKSVSDQLVAMLSADGPSVADGITNLAVPLGLPVITSDSPYIKPYKPFPLQLNAGLKQRTQTLIALARRLEWTSMSAVYVEDGACSEAMLRTAQAESRRLGINIAATVSLADWRGEEDDTVARDVVLRVRERAREGGLRAVMLLLPRRHLERILRAAKSLQIEGEIVPGEIIWLGVADEDLFQTYSENTRGSIVLQPKVGWVPEFESYFKSLNLSHAAARDPWFNDFWAGVFRCRGTACGSGLYRDLSSYQMEQDPEVVNIINAVKTVSHALESVRRELCPEHGSGNCATMSDITRVRRRLLDVTPHMAFVGAGMSGVAFSTSVGDNLGAGLRVLNVRRVGSGVYGLVPVGSVLGGGVGLELQQDTAKAYAPDMTEMALGDVESECKDCNEEETQSTHMEVSPGNPVTILGISSIHSPLPASLSHCGSLRSPDALQRAAAFAFAIEKANLASNFSGLSALLLDDCSLPSRAVYRTFGFLANTLDNSTIISNPNSVAVTILMDNVPNEGLSSLLSSQGIPAVLTEEEDSVIRARLHAALGVSHELGWSRLTVVRKEGSKWSKQASDMLLNEILPVTKTNCLGGELVVDSNSDQLAKTLQAEISSPLLLLFETPKEVEDVLNVLSEIRHRSRVIIASGWDSNSPINNTMDADIFTVSQDLNAEIVPGFREYVAASITTDSGVLPSDWIAEFLETANTGKWHQAQGVPDIVRIVSWIAEEVKRLCDQEEETPLCGQDANKFREEIRATLAVKMSARAPNLVIHRHNTVKSNEKVGSWKKVNGLSVNVKKWRRVDTNNECESYRVGRSGKLTSVLEEIPSPPGSLLGELRMLWGVICAALSVLGALLTIALVVYFASATRHAAGTSILGYQILFGVLLLYGSSFAFLMSPSEITCLIRRLLPGLAYAVVLSGMLVKVVTTWRCQGCTKGSLPDGDPLSRPCGLLCCAMALVVVQAFLAGGWLLLVPADVEPPTTLEGSWTCAAASGRELLGSLSFLAALLLTTAFVSLKARKDGESRSILACCVLLAVAGGAWVAAANSPTLADHHRDCVAGVIAGLVSATLVLLCVFVPKLLQHARLSREQERHQQQQQHAAVISHSKLQPVMYGVPHYPSVSSPHTLVIKAFPEPDELMGVEHMMSSSRGGSETTLEDDGSEPELAAIRDAEERSSSSGSGRLGLLGDHTLQVPSPLYPMDMFTGPPPTTSTFGHGAPPPPPMPRFSLVDHRVPGSNEFTAPPPPSEGAHGGDLDLSKHEGISYI